MGYTGKLAANGKVFDTTKGSGPFQFVMGQGEVIECWDKGFAEIPIGSKGTINCPEAMGYGDKEKPGIPANSDLVFDVELISCDRDELADVDLGALTTAPVPPDADAT